MPTLKSKIILSFNNVTKSLIRDIKNKNDEIKSCLKTNYVSFDKTSDIYISFFSKNMSDDMSKTLVSSENIFGIDSIKKINILKDISINDLLDKVATAKEDQNTLSYYLRIMFVLNYLYNLCIEDSVESTIDDINTDDTKYGEKMTGLSVLFEKTIKLISVLNTPIETEDDTENKFDIVNFTEDVFDEDIKSIFINLYNDRIQFRNIIDNDINQPDVEFPNLDIDMDFLNNSKIGSLAKEISDGIDISSMNLEDPSELLNVDKMFSDSNNPLGNIIQQVSSTITDKISSGELNQEELMKEAFSLMNKMNTGNASGNGGDNFMQSMMQNMMNPEAMSQMGNMFNQGIPGKTQSQSQSQTKQRLQKKLENKRSVNKKS